MAVEGRIFVDTWGWLVLADARDPSFDAVLTLRKAAMARQGGWVTTDYVLDETITRLFMVKPFAIANRFLQGIFEASRGGAVDIEHVTPERFIEAWTLRLRFKDKPQISFTDLTSFTVMRELGLERVITGDAHFAHCGFGFTLAP